MKINKENKRINRICLFLLQKVWFLDMDMERRSRIPLTIWSRIPLTIWCLESTGLKYGDFIVRLLACGFLPLVGVSSRRKSTLMISPKKS